MEIESNIPKIRVCIRKRPLTKKELAKSERDIIEVKAEDEVIIREQKVKLDLTKYVEEHCFKFDLAFNESQSNLDVYRSAVLPIVNFALRGGKVSCFAYGQTGSGKTYTMIGDAKNEGLYLLAARDLFKHIRGSNEGLHINVSYFEIYCGKLYDLLSNRKKLHAREDAKSNINIVGLKSFEVDDADKLFEVINYGNSVRVTSTTGKNMDSSRSHAILQIYIMHGSKQKGLLSFIDLAGNERGADTYDHDSQTRIDGAEISKSLLALKECIRALDQDKKHVPFRGSKLTMVLKDSFIGNCKTVMIGNISPAISNCEYTLNTLRYADRVKELKKDKDQRTQLNDELMLPRQPNNVVRHSAKLDPEPVIPNVSTALFNNAKNVAGGNKLFRQATDNSPDIHAKTPATNFLKSNSNFAKKIRPIESATEKPLFPHTNKNGPPQPPVPLLKVFDDEGQNFSEDDVEDLQDRHQSLINMILEQEEILIEKHKKHLKMMQNSSSIVSLLGNRAVGRSRQAGL